MPIRQMTGAQVQQLFTHTGPLSKRRRHAKDDIDRLILGVLWEHLHRLWTTHLFGRADGGKQQILNVYVPVELEREVETWLLESVL